MIAIVKERQGKGNASEITGNVYFDIKRFPEYGKLSGNQLENMLAGVRQGGVEDRHNAEDFPLWKAAEPGREHALDSPRVGGLPGHRNGCTPMSVDYLGSHVDIDPHGGA